MESLALERTKGRMKKEMKLKEAGRLGAGKGDYWLPFLHKIGSHVSF